MPVLPAACRARYLPDLPDIARSFDDSDISSPFDAILRPIAMPEFIDYFLHISPDISCLLTAIIS